MENEPNTIFTIIWIILILAATYFWWKMLFDCINNEKNSKGVWIFAMIFFHFFGSVAYYFLRKKKRATLGNY
ncbi:MAG: PLD nuclease N-terminal domain-containing protein [Bacteroidetes bacterium]|nr:PLD nuclease N-terminal domain-containing protein [Bacteroidota bacterium]MBU1114357.1 PLD nuclease N-terminal domain-containing protein [Bacteroidota bacterium]MBU1797344.1 PLD nuclease N-terminal domain-containing protein [Bacteroidota bacterium]